MSAPPPTEGRPPGARRKQQAAALLLVAGAAHAAIGVGGIAGLAEFETSVEEIERAVGTGLFASLATWGTLMLLVGIGELAAARALWKGSRSGWLAGHISAFCGLGGAFFTLAIFRLAGAVTIPLGFAVILLLGQSDRPAGPGDERQDL